MFFIKNTIHNLNESTIEFDPGECCELCQFLCSSPSSEIEVEQVLVRNFSLVVVFFCLFGGVDRGSFCSIIRTVLTVPCGDFSVVGDRSGAVLI